MVAGGGSADSVVSLARLWSGGLSLAVQTGKLFEDVGTGLLTSAVLVGLVWFRDVLLHRLAWAYRWTYSIVTRKRYVLMWIDDDRSHAQLLASA